VRIDTVLQEAQDGQTIANLARAFHLPPEKVQIAVSAMLGDLTALVEKRAQSRRSLAGLIELLGQTGYERVLETPALLGATHTQVLGTDALKFIAGRGAGDRMAHSAAEVAGITEMISEYLLPVVAALLVGALTMLSRPALAAIINGGPVALDAIPASGAERQGLQLPRVSGGFGFSGSTGGGSSFIPALATDHYLALAEDILRSDRAPGTTDPTDNVRKVIEVSLGLPDDGTAPSDADWATKMQRWANEVMDALFPRRR
jgi:hypothetical protein